MANGTAPSDIPESGPAWVPIGGARTSTPKKPVGSASSADPTVAPPATAPPDKKAAPAPAGPPEPQYVSDYPFERRKVGEGTPASKESWGRAGVRHGIEIGGGIAGVAGGEVAGLPAVAGNLATLNIPGAAVAAYGAGKAGEATGLTIADAINAEIDKYHYGRETDFTVKNGLKDLALNLAGTMGGSWVLEHIPLLSKVVSGSKDAAEDFAKATETSQTLRSQYQEEAGGIAKGQFNKAVEAQEEAVKKAEPSAQREIVEKTTGRTPETAAQTQVPISTVQAGGTFGAPAEHLQAKRGFQDTYTGIRERLYKGYSNEYDSLLGNYKKQDTKDIGDVVNELRKQEVWQQQNAQIPYNPATNRLIARGKALFDPKNLNEKNLRDLGQTNKVFFEGAGGLREYELDPDEKLLLPISGKGISFGQLMAFRSLAKRTAANSSDDISAKAASELEDAATRAYLKQGLPDEVQAKLGNLNDRYRDFKLTFDHVTGRAVSKAGDAVAAGNEVFTNPKLTERMLANAQVNAPRFDAAGKQIGTVNEREEIKTAFGDWAQSNPKSVFTDDPVKAEMRARAFKKIDPDSPLGSAKALQMVSGRMDNLRTSPKAMAEFEAGFTGKLNEIQTKGAIQIRDVGKGLLAKMGPIGQNVIRQVDAAKTPVEQARIVDEFFSKMDDKGFSQLVGQQQTTFGKSLTEPMAGPRAGVGGVWARVKRQWPLYVGGAAVTGMLFPHPSGFYMFAGGAGATMALRDKYQNFIVRTLASKYGDVAMSSLTNNAYRMLGDYTVRALADVGGSKVAKGAEAAAFPDKPKPAPTTSIKVGPMSKDIERKQATQIATERGRQDPTHIDQVQDLHMQVASGETPDIHTDLSSGRLSNEEVTKMVRPSKPGTDALFDNMSLADAVEAFGHGTDDEKALGLSALAQKIQNEGQNLQPAQRRALMVRLRQSLTSGDEGGLA